MVKKRGKNKNNFVDWLIVAFFGIWVAISLIPLFNIFSLSLADDKTALAHPGMLLPPLKTSTFGSYKAIFKSEAIYRSFLISLLVTAIATTIHIATTLLSGFVLSNKRLPGRNALLFFILITMLFGGGLIPTYLVISSYGMVDTMWVLILPGAVSGYSIILMKNFISNIPASLIEAAEVDGANPFYILVRIVAPLSVPIIATLALMCAVGKWNDWMTGFIYIKKNKLLWPFQNVLQTLVVNADTQNSVGMDLSKFNESFKNALIVVSLIPVIVIYLFAQRFLIKGIFIGSVKE